MLDCIVAPFHFSVLHFFGSVDCVRPSSPSPLLVYARVHALPLLRRVIRPAGRCHELFRFEIKR
ncbi:hypothetical protein [Bradyrhizobium sp. C9]|uniref:hypothetical protein n=1 Tax=Bradyrhizobium sp. C9 TaxID=142585 RepID=UPI0011776D05|nr:hypothetical protein [Bradyrhizobium sp. C9]